MKNVSAVDSENFQLLESDEQEIITSLCGRSFIRITPADSKELSLKNIADKLETLAQLRAQIS